MSDIEKLVENQLQQSWFFVLLDVDEEGWNPSKVHSESNFHFSHGEKEPDSSVIFLWNNTADENLTAIWKQQNWADRTRRMWRETFMKTQTQEYQNPNAATAAN